MEVPRPRIFILNHLNLRETHLGHLREIGEVIITADTLTEKQAIARLKSANIAVVDGFKAPLGRAVIDRTAGLQLVILTSTAFHMVDLEAAKEKGVKVANTPAYATEAVAEHAIALMFAAVRAIPLGDRAVRANPFQVDLANEEHLKFLGFELRGKVLGVIGLGAIGSRVAELGLALGMRVLAYNRTFKMMSNVETTSLDEVLSRSDIVSVNLALNGETENIISERELALMKPGSVLINTADGRHVNTRALFSALQDGRISAAGLDVLAEWDRSNPLLTLDNVVFAPQSASCTREASANLAESIVQTVEAFASGRPINLVS